MAVPAIAQECVNISDTLSYEIHFRWDKSRLDTMYMGNNHVFDAIISKLDSIGIPKIDSVVIVSQSSPEGPYYHNQNLSKRRAATMRAYMERRHPEIADRLTIVPEGESWGQLRHYVARDTILSKADRERLL